VNPALDKGDVAAYLTWIRSDAGQKVVKEVGYFPLAGELAGKIIGESIARLILSSS
jgi:ABC-type phosphate transport system substrate-binding protein